VTLFTLSVFAGKSVTMLAVLKAVLMVNKCNKAVDITVTQDTLMLVLQSRAQISISNLEFKSRAEISNSNLELKSRTQISNSNLELKSRTQISNSNLELKKSSR
jgi:hypothetical protein